MKIVTRFLMFVGVVVLPLLALPLSAVPLMGGCAGGGDDTADDDAADDEADDAADDSADDDSGDADVPEDEIALSTIDELPRSTYPVSAEGDALRTVIKAASTGVPLSGLEESPFGTGDSLAMCEMTQVFSGVIAHASESDSIVCAIQTVLAGQEGLYDGEYHFYDMAIGEGGPGDDDFGDDDDGGPPGDDDSGDDDGGMPELNCASLTSCDDAQNTAVCNETEGFGTGCENPACTGLAHCFAAVEEFCGVPKCLGEGDFGALTAKAEEGGPGGGNIPDHMKVKIVRNDDNRITEFELFVCNSGTQFAYVHQTIDQETGALAMRLKAVETEQQAQIDVEGTLDLANGTFTGEKTITTNFGGPTPNGEDGYDSGVLTQLSDQISYDGYRGMGDDQGSNSERILSSAQLIDTNDLSDLSVYDPTALAVGDGAAHAIILFTNLMDPDPATNTITIDVVQGWNGDTLLVDNADDGVAAAFIDEVGGDDPVADEGAPTIAFEASETYDCGTTAEAEVTGDSGAQACFNRVHSDRGLDCRNISGIDVTGFEP